MGALCAKIEPNQNDKFNVYIYCTKLRELEARLKLKDTTYKLGTDCKDDDETKSANRISSMTTFQEHKKLCNKIVKKREEFNKQIEEVRNAQSTVAEYTEKVLSQLSYQKEHYEYLLDDVQTFERARGVIF